MTQISVSAVGRLKHTALWEAAKKAGGQAALGRLIGIDPQTIGRYVNMQEYPKTRWEELDPLFLHSRLSKRSAISAAR